MKENIFIFKILLPITICFILINIVKIPFSFYPLSFGLIIGLANWNIYKYKLFLGVLLSIFVSYLAFFIAYFSFTITGKMFSFMKGDSGSVLGIVISTYIIAPLLVFTFYKFVFKIINSKITIFIIIASISILVLMFYFLFSVELIHESLDLYTIWQMIMILALQLIIYQSKIFKPIKK
ncbi:MAG: hypothetical protein COB60_12990 [Flavobacteriaceae bacterium]|nr:MAG: hypothetical protein COB60_12990 [Flavobacteriaceae bacterium]